jgi:hypothetical protein
MDRSDGAFFRVDEENGDAVGSLYTKKEIGTVGDGSVAAARLSGRGVEEMDDVGVDLFQRNEFETGSGESGLEAAAVFEDVFSGVPFGETQV